MYENIDSVLMEGDFIVLAIPLTTETNNLISKRDKGHFKEPIFNNRSIVSQNNSRKQNHSFSFKNKNYRNFLISINDYNLNTEIFKTNSTGDKAKRLLLTLHQKNLLFNIQKKIREANSKKCNLLRKYFLFPFILFLSMTINLNIKNLLMKI